MNRAAASLRVALFLLILFLLSSPTVVNRPLAAEPAGGPPLSVQPGVLELAGSTAVSVNYQNESGGIRETTQLRVTPSIGYFILTGLEVMLNATYILDIVHNEDPLYHDDSQRFLFTLGPAYNAYQFSDTFVPYAGLLLGMYYHHLSTDSQDAQRDSRSDLQFALGLTAGIRWLLTENLSMRGGLQYVHGFRETEVGSTNYLGFELGVSVFIPTWPSLTNHSTP